MNPAVGMRGSAREASGSGEATRPSGEQEPRDRGYARAQTAPSSPQAKLVEQPLIRAEVLGLGELLDLLLGERLEQLIEVREDVGEVFLELRRQRGRGARNGCPNGRACLANACQ